MDEIKKMLDEEIKTEIRSLSTLESGSKEKSTAIDNLAMLYKLRIEETKNELDFKDKAEKRVLDADHHKDETVLQERDSEFKEEQLSEQVKDRYFRLGIAAAEILLPLMFYAAWMRRGFKFEESGTYTSTTFRGLFNRFRPTK